MHSEEFFKAATKICLSIDKKKIEKIAESLVNLNGRLFVIGVGGSAANASHAVNDFRKLCHIEAYAPTDNVAEITARTNDDGFDTVFSDWLKVSNFSKDDALFVLSVGGGSTKASFNIVQAVRLAKEVGAKVFGIVGREDGYTAQNADIAIVVPIVKEEWVTPLSEAFQGLVWHSLVSNPLLSGGAEWKGGILIY